MLLVIIGKNHCQREAMRGKIRKTFTGKKLKYYT